MFLMCLSNFVTRDYGRIFGLINLRFMFCRVICIGIVEEKKHSSLLEHSLGKGF